ncbi:hypothetical protein [Streptomyces sp. NPDC046985]|uniref:hypothetical protein n=1 Tax=Streptomyces sp. NPDC046985 TaxID=3155377 RepID=UPI0033CF6C97
MQGADDQGAGDMRRAGNRRIPRAARGVGAAAHRSAQRLRRALVTLLCCLPAAVAVAALPLGARGAERAVPAWTRAEADSRAGTVRSASDRPPALDQERHTPDRLPASDRPSVLDQQPPASGQRPPAFDRPPASDRLLLPGPVHGALGPMYGAPRPHLLPRSAWLDAAARHTQPAPRHDDLRHDDLRQDDLRQDDVRHDDRCRPNVRHDDRHHPDLRRHGKSAAVFGRRTSSPRD